MCSDCRIADQVLSNGIGGLQGMQPVSYAVSTVFRGSLAKMLRLLQTEAKYVACDRWLEERKRQRRRGGEAMRA